LLDPIFSVHDFCYSSYRIEKKSLGLFPHTLSCPLSSKSRKPKGKNRGKDSKTGKKGRETKRKSEKEFAFTFYLSFFSPSFFFSLGSFFPRPLSFLSFFRSRKLLRAVFSAKEKKRGVKIK
jgi:hypothetical protein